jgi:aldehyde dehydrogenase (NAD+)
VHAPADGSLLAGLAQDDAQSVAEMGKRARVAQARLAALPRRERAFLLEKLSVAVRQAKDALGGLITLEGGKTVKEGVGEAESSADVLLKTVADASLPEFSGMIRVKERPPVGVVGLITSFNFPLVVAHWTLAPALLAGNAVLWKPSEKTPLTALGLKGVFDAALPEWSDLLHIVVGGREAGSALVAEPQVDMVSATGSVAMGRGIKVVLERRAGRVFQPILELGGNNGVIISDKIDDAHRDFALDALLNSYYGTSGQRCTNTRRLIVHEKQLQPVVAGLKARNAALMDSGAVANPLSGVSNAYGYGPLIDGDAYARFVKSMEQAKVEGGQVWGGERVLKELEGAYYVAPAIAVMPNQTAVMHEETFAPLLFITPYAGDVGDALMLLNAPDNAGLVAGIYTQSQREADMFAASAQAGHVLINGPKGTGTPAFGMGFGGNKASGEGEILNSADPLRAFTRDTQYRRIAQNVSIVMDRH